MIERQIDSPIPKPVGFVVWKGANSPAPSAAKPGPESRTVTCTPPPSAFSVLMSSSRVPSSIRAFGSSVSSRRGYHCRSGKPSRVFVIDALCT
jgi:hypothetical protein